MSDDIIRKEDLFDVIKHGTAWYGSKIKELLGGIIANSAHSTNAEIRLDSDDKYYYLYDNECYLFIFDGKIQIRCDRDSVFSAGATVDYPIQGIQDIEAAFRHFASMAMEVEDDD